MKQQNTEGGSVCPRCGKVFTCGLLAGHARCWCADLPPVLPLPQPEAGCYCPECLNEIINLGRA